MLKSAETAQEIKLNVGKSLDSMQQLFKSNVSPTTQSAQQSQQQRRVSQISQRRSSHLVITNPIQLDQVTPSKPTEPKVLDSEKSSSSLTKTNKRSSSKSSQASQLTVSSKEAKVNPENERQIEIRIKKWKESEGYSKLPENARLAVESGMRRQKHSDFYYRLKELTERLYLFTAEYDKRVPVFEQAYRKKQAEEKKKAVTRMLRKQRRAQREQRENQEQESFISPVSKTTRSISPNLKRESSTSTINTKLSVSQFGGMSYRKFELQKAPNNIRQQQKSPIPISIKPRAEINSNLQKQTKNENDPRSIIE